MEWLIFCGLMVIFLSICLWNMFNTMQRDPNSFEPLPPGSFGIPILGETISLLTQGSSFYDDNLKRYGKIYRTHLFGSPTIRVVGEENAHIILSGENDIVVSHWPKSMQLLLDGGLLMETSGPSHTALKKIVLKAFTRKALERYIPCVSATCKTHIAMWCQTGQLLMYPALRRLAFDISSRVLTGSNQTQDEVDCNMALFQDFVDGFFSLPINLPGFTFRKALSAREKLLQRIEECLICLDMRNTNVMTLLQPLSDDRSVDKETLKRICLDLLFASHETTSSAAYYLILCLSKYEDVTRRLDKELRESGAYDSGYCMPNKNEDAQEKPQRTQPTQAIKDAGEGKGHITTLQNNTEVDTDQTDRRNMNCNRSTTLEKPVIKSLGDLKADECNLTFEATDNLIYLRNIVKESMRLCCPIGAGFRKVIKTFVLGGYQIPKNWLVAYSIRESHETSDFFMSPRDFNPSRWNNLDNNAHHFLCFGGGRRRCVGKEFSILFLKVLIIEMMRMCVWKIRNINAKIVKIPSPHPSDGMPALVKRKKKESQER